MKNTLHLLASRRFLPLFVTQFFGAFNDNAFKNAFLIWFTFDIASQHSINAPMMVTIAAGLFILPFFLLSATAGQIADKFEKSGLVRRIKLVEIILMLACSFCFFYETVYGLLALLFLMGTQSTFFGPIKYSLLPEHLKDDELIAGNGLIEGGTFLAILLGTIFGGLIIRTESGFEILSFSIISFALIGWFASRYIPSAPAGDNKLRVNYNFASETLKIIGYAKVERTVWLSILGISWFWLIGATFLTQFPTYTKEVIGGNEHIITLFLTLFSVGIGMGSLWCNKLLKGEINGRLVPYGCIAMTTAMMLFFLSTLYYEAERMLYVEHVLLYEDKILELSEFFSVGISSWLIVASLLMLSVSAGVYIVPLYAIMQHRSDEHYLARIIASNNVMNALFMVLSSLIVIALFSLGLSVEHVLLTVGIFNLPVYFLVKSIVKRRLSHD